MFYAVLRCSIGAGRRCRGTIWCRKKAPAGAFLVLLVSAGLFQQVRAVYLLCDILRVFSLPLSQLLHLLQ